MVSNHFRRHALKYLIGAIELKEHEIGQGPCRCPQKLNLGAQLEDLVRGHDAGGWWELEGVRLVGAGQQTQC